MTITTLIRLLLGITLAVFCFTQCLAQNTNLTASGSSDPKSILLEAARVDGLSGKDLKPWRMKLSFTTYDDSGKEEEHGNMEYAWAGPGKYT
jgi:hypothetical protein